MNRIALAFVLTCLILVAATAAAAPPAGPGIAAARVTGDPTQADVTITASPDDPGICTHYKLYRAPTSPWGPWVEIVTIPAAGAASYIWRDSGLDPGMAYRYGLRAFNDYESSQFVSSDLQDAPPDPAITPGDPELSAARVAGDATQANVTIAASPDDPSGCTHYKLWRHATSPTGKWVVIATIEATGAAAYAYHDSGLVAGTAYRYGVRAYNGQNRSDLVMAPLANVEDLDPSITPRDPGIAAQRVEGDAAKADITITKSPDDPTGCTHYRIFRLVTSPLGTWQEIATVIAMGAASYVYRDAGIDPNGTYKYGARAYNGYRRSALVCAVLTGTGPDPGVTPGDPGIAAVRVAGDATKANVTITASPDDPTGCTSYKLYRLCTSPMGPWVQIATIAATGAAAYSFADSGLIPGSSYRYGVRALNGANRSAFVVTRLKAAGS